MCVISYLFILSMKMKYSEVVQVQVSEIYLLLIQGGKVCSSVTSNSIKM